MSVVVSTFNRANLVGGVCAALDRQDAVGKTIEAIIVDNGSDDGTWAVLERAVTDCALPFTAVRLQENVGAGGGRNAGAALARGEVIAFTDDDCLPDAGWAASLAAAFDDRKVAVAQGRVEAVHGDRRGAGPWDRVIEVGACSPWFETANVAYRRATFEMVGGFDITEPLTSRAGRRPFGEDAVLGADVLARGGRHVFVEGAVVGHPVRRMGFWDALVQQGILVEVPALAVRCPPVRQVRRNLVFLNARTQRFDLAAVGIVAAIVSRRTLPALAALPWLISEGRRVAHFADGSPLRIGRALGQAAVFDAVGLVALITGSARHGLVVL